MTHYSLNGGALCAAASAEDALTFHAGAVDCVGCNSFVVLCPCHPGGWDEGLWVLECMMLSERLGANG